jgi:hypothetical protein
MLTNVESQIQMKENRMEKAKSVKDFKLCDQLIGDVRALLREKRECEKQLAALKKVEEKSKWYHKRKSIKSQETLSSPPPKIKKGSDLSKFFKDHTEDAGDRDDDVMLQPDKPQQLQPNNPVTIVIDLPEVSEANTQNPEWNDSVFNTEDVDCGSSSHSGASADTIIGSPPSSPILSTQPF